MPGSASRGGQRLHPRRLSARPQRPLCGSAGRRGLGLHADSGRRSRRDPVRRGGAAGRPGQLRLRPDAEPPDCDPGADAAPFRARAGQGARLPRRLARRLSRTPPHRPLRRNGALKTTMTPDAPLNSAQRRPSWTAWTSPRLAHPAHSRTKPEEADKRRAAKTGQVHSLSTAIVVGSVRFGRRKAKSSWL